MRFILSLIIILVSNVVCYGQLMSEQDRLEYRSYFPLFEDKYVQNVIDNPRSVWYTEKEMPRAYQFSMERATGLNFHSVNYNISADAGENAKGPGNGGNAGADFPWKAAGGTDKNTTDTVRIMLLPEGKPIAWYIDDYQDFSRRQKGYSWIFPTGTIFLEALALDGPKGKYIYEVRTRERYNSYWAVNIFRPFPTKEDLEEKIGKFTSNFQKVSLSGTHRTNQSFSKDGYYDVLPELNEELVHNLLTKTPFKSAMGEVWAYNSDGKPCYAPTSLSSKFSIVPPKYKATLLGTDESSCMDCHKHTGKSVDFFDQPRDWYGYVPGSDGILSFHIADPSCISRNGSDIPVVLNRKLIQAGLLEKYNSAKHSREDYHIIEFLK